MKSSYQLIKTIKWISKPISIALMSTLMFTASCYAEGGEVTIKWDSIDDVRYRLYYGYSRRDYTDFDPIDVNKDDRCLVSDHEASCVISDLEADRTYHFAVRAYSDESESSFSEEIVYTIPNNSSAKSNGNGMISLLSNGDFSDDLSDWEMDEDVNCRLLGRNTVLFIPYTGPTLIQRIVIPENINKSSVTISFDYYWFGVLSQLEEQMLVLFDSTFTLENDSDSLSPNTITATRYDDTNQNMITFSAEYDLSNINEANLIFSYDESGIGGSHYFLLDNVSVYAQLVPPRRPPPPDPSPSSASGTEEKTTNIIGIQEVPEFVSRFYRICLGREPEQTGLDSWVNGLLNGSVTGSDVAYGFIFSEEFTNRNTTNEEYLYVLYRAFFNREPDSGGFNSWLDVLNSSPTGDRSTRENVLNGFINSLEFENLCNSYGIAPYSA